MVVYSLTNSYKKLHSFSITILENHINNIYIRKMFERFVKDVRTKTWANTASDHYLEVVKLKLKLKKQWITRETALQVFNTAVLRNAVIDVSMFTLLLHSVWLDRYKLNQGIKWRLWNSTFFVFHIILYICSTNEENEMIYLMVLYNETVINIFFG